MNLNILKPLSENKTKSPSESNFIINTCKYSELLALRKPLKESVSLEDSNIFNISESFCKSKHYRINISPRDSTPFRTNEYVAMRKPKTYNVSMTNRNTLQKNESILLNNIY